MRDSPKKERFLFRYASDKIKIAPSNRNSFRLCNPVTIVVLLPPNLHNRYVVFPPYYGCYKLFFCLESIDIVEPSISSVQS